MGAQLIKVTPLVQIIPQVFVGCDFAILHKPDLMEVNRLVKGLQGFHHLSPCYLGQVRFQGCTNLYFANAYAFGGERFKNLLWFLIYKRKVTDIVTQVDVMPEKRFPF